MVVTVCIMLELVGDRTDAKGDPILMRGDNKAVVWWVTRCGGARDKRVCLLMIILGRLQIAGGGTALPNTFRVQNTLEDGISRWSGSLLADKIKELINSSD